MSDGDAARALIFDCDGVLADTERYGHLPAFNQMFAEFGVPVHWTEAEYGEKLTIGGGKERMASLLTEEFVAAANLPRDASGQRELIASWHKRKTEIYTELVASGRLPGRPGVRRLVTEAAAADWSLAVASTSAPESVQAVLEHVVGTDLAARFLVLAGDVVAHKKPAPDIYQLAQQQLAVAGPRTLVVEDSSNGFQAARAAGLTCLITVNGYTRDEDFTGAALVVSSLGDPDGEHTTVLADGSGVPIGDWITESTLRAVLAAGAASENRAAAPTRPASR